MKMGKGATRKENLDHLERAGADRLGRARIATAAQASVAGAMIPTRGGRAMGGLDALAPTFPVRIDLRIFKGTTTMRPLHLLLLAMCMPALCFGADAARDLRHAKALLARVPLVDGHNDLPWNIREAPGHPNDVDAFDLRASMPGETDLARLKQGGVAAQFWSVYVPGELTEGWARVQLEQIDLTKRMIARYPERLTFATTSADIARAKRAGKVASFLGIEGGHVIENSLGTLRAYYDLGARYMTLTHNVTLDWADAALGERKHGGLTPFGVEVVREMNRLGMLVDLSHVSAEVMAQALEASEAPVIFSHSSAQALVDHPRNVPDAILRRMAANGGVVMVTFVPAFVSNQAKEWQLKLGVRTKGLAHGGAEFNAIEADYIKEHGAAPKATLAQVADHIDYIAKLAGAEHVGIAADYCCGTNPVGLEDVSTYPALFAELIRRGWTDANLAKLAGGNLIRAFAKAEQVAARLQRQRKPSLALIGEKH
jgi:membrane dipeptidase